MIRAAALLLVAVSPAVPNRSMRSLITPWAVWLLTGTLLFGDACAALLQQHTESAVLAAADRATERPLAGDDDGSAAGRVPLDQTAMIHREAEDSPQRAPVGRHALCAVPVVCGALLSDRAVPQHLRPAASTAPPSLHLRL